MYVCMYVCIYTISIHLSISISISIYIYGLRVNPRLGSFEGYPLSIVRSRSIFTRYLYLLLYLYLFISGELLPWRTEPQANATGKPAYLLLDVSG